MKKNKTFLWILLLALSVIVWQWFPTSDRTPAHAQKNTSSSRTITTAVDAPAELTQAAQVSPVAAAPTPIQQPSMAAITDFRDWANSYLAAPQEQRKSMLKTGQELAITHTQMLAEMIPLDPEQAIANAVPMVIRQDLPESIVSLLEKRVRLKAALTVNGNVPLPGQENSPDFKPYTRVVSTEQGKYWNAYVYGKRGQQRSLNSTFVNGISVGYDMAVADSTVRQLETGERPVPDGREVVETCPVSKEETVVARTEEGTLPPVTVETPAFETAERVVFVCSGGHIQQVAEEYATEEERAHWESRGATLNAGAGSGAPTDPISSIPGGATTGQRSILYIRVTFPDHLIDPQSEAECYDSLRQMADYISNTSYGRCYYTYTVAPLIVLPYPESWYVQYQNDGASADSILRGHAITLARAAGYDNLTYDNEVIRWSGTVGSYGGSAGVGGRNINLKTNSVGTFCHELGHNLGLWHANYWQTNPPSSIGPGSNGEYGNTFDLLGNSSGLGQFTSYFKSVMSWLPNDNHWTVNSPGVYRIHQFDYPIADPSYRFAIRIKKDAERDYWAEFRQLHTTNTGFMNGLMLTWDRWGQGNIGGSGGSPGNGSNGGTHLLDMTPGSFGNGITDTRNDAALWVGRTFSDEDAKIHITPIAKNTSTVPPSMDVYVFTGDAPGNLAPTLSLSASSTSVATNTSVTFTATAADSNGDPIAYAWVFNDGTYSTNNNAVQTKSWSTAGHYQVLCTASDMKGKRTTRAILVTVGSPTTFTVSGTITGPDALPMEGVYVASHAPSNLTSHPNSGTFKGTWTDSNGNYTLTGLAAGNYTISPNLYPNVFTPSNFTNPVTVGPSTTNKNFGSTSLPTITINVTDPTANEGPSPGTGTVRIERSGSTTNALSVQIFNTNTGTAVRNTDYTLSPAPTASTAGGGSGTSEYIIPAGASFLDITVTPVNDSTAEGKEYAALDFANTSGGYILTGAAVAYVEIIDDENGNLPVVKLTQLDNVAYEQGVDTATLQLERNGSTTANLTVNLTMTGTATNVSDYTIPSSVIIPAGSASTTLTLTPIDDAAQESTETAIVTIATNAAYARDTLSNNQTITIHDNDLPVLTIAATDAILTETPGDPGVFTITKTGGNPYQALTVDYAISGRAVHGADYRRLEGRAIIPAGAASTTIEIYPIDDTVDEGIQDVIIRLRSSTSYSIGGTGTSTMSITDNDASQVYVKLTQSGVIEPATGSITAVSYQIIRPISGSAITVNYAMSGTATSGVDYTALPGTIAFAAGDTTKTINVAALADAFFEDAESVTLTLLPGTGYTLMTSQTPSATGFIVDGDQPTIDVSPANTVTSLTTDGTETSTSLRFIISRDVATASALIVNYTMSGAATEGVDYTGTTGTATILANTTSAYVTLVPVNDTIPEGVETIVMNITPAPGTYGLRTPVATMLLGDNDAFSSGSVAFAPSTSSTTEAAGTHNVVVNLTGTPAGTVKVSYRLSAGTATGGYDFTFVDGSLTFPPGTTTQNIPITILTDILAESAETIVLQLYNVTGGNLGTSTHTVTLNNISMPEAFSDAPSNLLANGVTLNGRVIPNSLATNRWFEYGPTTAYGSTTASQATGSGTTSVSVNAALSGFAPGGYHFRCVAQNSMGTTYGIDQIVPSSDANLVNLITSSGSLSPTFQSSTLVYSVVVASGVTSITVTPTTAQANATIKINGINGNSGTASAPITLVTGITPINVVVTAQDGVTTKTYTLNVDKQTNQVPQSITFNSLPAKNLGDAPFALTATASSGLPVSYSSSNSSIASISGSTVTILSAGTTTITASQDGDVTYAPATPVGQLFTVNATPTYTISYNGNGHNGGSVPSAVIKTQNVNLNVALQGSLTRSGYAFTGWNTIANGTGTPYAAGATYSANAAATLFAQWTPNTYNLTFEANSGDAPTPSSKSVIFDATYGALATISRVGYFFEGWFTAPTGGTEVFATSTVTTASNHSLYAQWSPNNYTVTFQANGGNAPTPTTKEVTFDAPYGILATVSRAGYTFDGWFTAASGGTEVTENNAAVTPNNHNLYARWSPIVISVITNLNTVNVPEGSTASFQVKLSDLPLTNVTVTVARSSGDEGITVSTGASLTFTTATWDTYQTVTLASATDADTDNDTATITCTPGDPSYTAKNVSAVQVDKDTTLTLANDGNGTTTPSSAVIVEKNVATAISATSNEGYDFLNWSVTSGSATILDANAASTTATLVEPATIQANFTIKTYIVSYDGNENTSGTAPSSQTKNHGQTLALATNTGALNKIGFSFAGWNTAADGSGSDYPASFAYTANAPLTLFAKWAPGADGTWIPTTAGPFDWGTTTNWVGGNVASGADRTASFTPNITAAQTANLDAPRTIGNITFTDSSTNSHNLTISGANILTLSRSSGIPVIDVTQSTRTLTIASQISGSNGLQKNGAGILTLSSTANDYMGGTTLNGGTLIVSANSNLGDATTPINVNASTALTSSAATNMDYTRAITLANSATLTLQNTTGSTTATFSGSITGSSGITIASGSGSNTVALSDTANTFTGDLSLLAAGNTNLFVRFASIGDAGMISLGKGSWRRVVQYTGAADLVLNTRRIDLNSSFGGINDGGGTPIQLFENNGSGTVTFGSTMTVANGKTGTFFFGGSNLGNNAHSAVIPNSIGGTLSIGKIGAGKWILSNDNTFSGTLTLSGGTLVLSGTNSFTGSTTLNTATLSVNSVSDYGVASAIGAATSGAIILGSTSGTTGTFEYTGSGHSSDRQFQIGGSNQASGNGIILNNGNGPLVLDAPIFNISVPNTGGSSGTRNLTLGGSYTTGVNEIQGDIISYADPALRDIAIIKTNPSAWKFSGNSTYTKTTTIQEGTLIAGNNSPNGAAGAFGNTNSEIALGVAGGNNGAALLISGAFNVGRIIRIPTNNTTDAGTRVLTLGGNSAHNSEFSGNIILGTNSQAGRSVTLTAASSGRVTFSGIIQNPTSMDATTYTVTKNGAGTVVLTNANTYTGATSVSEGILLVNNTTGSGTGTGVLNVTANATLGGTGIIGGNTTIAANGLLEFNLSTADIYHDKLEFAATKTLTFSGASALTITATSGAAHGSYVLLTAPGGIVGNAPASLNLPAGWAATVAKVGNDLVLTVTSAGGSPITYHANNASSGTAPGNQTKVTDVPLTLSNNTGPLTRTGFIFAGWNTAADGNGTTYTEGASYTANAGTTLYAKWITPYTAWTLQTYANPFTNTDPNADFDGDGLSNLLEYAFGIDPTIGGNGDLTYNPGGAVTNPGNRTRLNVAQGVGVDFRAIFARRKDYQAVGLTYTVEFSADLTNWVTSTTTPTVLTGSGASNPAAVEAVSVPYPLFIPIAGGGFKKPTFFRITVSSN